MTVAKKKKSKAVVDKVKQLVYNTPVRTEEIKRRREELGLTMAEAARRAGWETQQAWSGVERGMRSDPQVSTLMRVAKALGCTVNDLLRK